MTTELKMNIDERYKYLRMMQIRYQSANKTERSLLLDEMEAMTDCHRKSLVRHMNSDLSREQRRVQRGRTYGIEMHAALKVIDESYDHICAERLQPSLPAMAKHLAAHGELELSAKLEQQLGQISISTVRRITTRLQQDQPRLPQKGPEQANQAARQVPIQSIAWDEAEPGHFEVDMVHHCGTSAAGQFVHTLQMIDVTTGWSERVATLGRSYLVMADGFERMLTRLPFPVHEIHSDNGSEFLNHQMLRFWPEVDPTITLSRSRPYQKNDSRFVEQKNSTLVRAYLDYRRLDTVEQTCALNRLYDQMWLYYNFFQPVMRLAEKSIVQKEGRKKHIKRKYDQAQTPFDRLCATGCLDEGVKAQLERQREATNPRQLRREIQEGLRRLRQLPLADPEQTEDVRQTLLQNTEAQLEQLFTSSPTVVTADDPLLVTLSFDRTISAR
jgi:hypothetical protein